MDDTARARQNASRASRPAERSSSGDPAGPPQADGERALRVSQRARCIAADERKHAQCRAALPRLLVGADGGARLPAYGFDPTARVTQVAQRGDRATARARRPELDSRGIYRGGVPDRATRDDAVVG